MPLIHLVAHVRTTGPNLWEFDLAVRLWSGLRRAFPMALGACLMPDHVHLVGDEPAPQEAQKRFRRALAGFAWGIGPVWEPIPEPKIIRGPDKLRRDLRYVALNPIRKRLSADPMECLWSTHRDLLGAVADPWVPLDRLDPHLGWLARDLRRSWHGYVSKDHEVAMDGTPLPQPEPPHDVPTRSLDDIARAAAAATRAPTSAVTRRGPTRKLFFALARQQGWTRARTLADFCRVTASAVRAARIDIPREALAAASLCLGDDRLLLPPSQADPPQTCVQRKKRRGLSLRLGKNLRSSQETARSARGSRS